MKESYTEGLANHSGRESCAGDRKVAGEALAAVRTGWVLSPENRWYPGADTVALSGKQHQAHRYCKMRLDLAWSETPCMYGNSLHWNWESPCSTARDRGGVRVGNPKGESR